MAEGRIGIPRAALHPGARESTVDTENGEVRAKALGLKTCTAVG